MALRDYNGFSGRQRQDSYDWLKREMAAGRVPPPSRCCICGQDHGPLAYHAEDYSRPYGPHIWAYPVCWLCHMMIHCRFRKPDAFNAYRVILESGRRWSPIGQNWGRFCQEFLGSQDFPEPDETIDSPVQRLDDVLCGP